MEKPLNIFDATPMSQLVRLSDEAFAEYKDVGEGLAYLGSGPVVMEFWRKYWRSRIAWTIGMVEDWRAENIRNMLANQDKPRPTHAP